MRARNSQELIKKGEEIFSILHFSPLANSLVANLFKACNRKLPLVRIGHPLTELSLSLPGSTRPNGKEIESLKNFSPFIVQHRSI